MMENPHFNEEQEIKELLRKYQNLRSGSSLHFLEEEAFERIIDYYDENEQLNQALEAAECGIRQFPYSSLLLIKKADLLIASERFDESLELLEKLSALDSSDIDIHVLKIDAWLGIGDESKARELFSDSAATFQGIEKVHFLLDVADVFDDYGLFDEVFQCLHDILLLDPENEEALYKICFWTDYSKNFEESIKLHLKLIDEVPYNHLAWFNLGTAYQGLNLHEKAVDAYLYATAIDENFEYAYRNLGDAYICLKEFESAIEPLEKVLELAVPEPVVYEALGHCYQKMNRMTQARTNYRKALHLNPENCGIHYRIAKSYMYEEKWGNAVDHLNQALRISPEGKPAYLLVLGRCLNKAGYMQEAVNTLVKYISLRPANITGWKDLITVLFEHGYYEQAFIESENAYNSTGQKPALLYYQAAICLKLGMKKEGLALLEEALSKSPRSLKIFFSLDPAFLQRASVVKIINAHLKRKEKAKKKNK